MMHDGVPDLVCDREVEPTLGLDGVDRNSDRFRYMIGAAMMCIAHLVKSDHRHFFKFPVDELDDPSWVYGIERVEADLPILTLLLVDR